DLRAGIDRARPEGVGVGGIYLKHRCRTADRQWRNDTEVGELARDVDDGVAEAKHHTHDLSVWERNAAHLLRTERARVPRGSGFGIRNDRMSVYLHACTGSPVAGMPRLIVLPLMRLDGARSAGHSSAAAAR